MQFTTRFGGKGGLFGWVSGTNKVDCIVTFSTNVKKSPTAIVMMNLGGPGTQEEVGPFLTRLFSDREIMQLPFQDWSAPLIAKRRTPKIKKQYQEIGGGSPLRLWTQKQGEALVKLLDQKSPETAPHKYYMAFRYASPLTEETLQQMKADGIKRAVAFSQYPQYSCSTTGSSLNEMWRKLKEFGMEEDIKWSVVDRWATHPGLIKAFAKNIRDGLNTYPEKERKDTVILFSAHSLPMRVVDKGDPYPQEVAATVQRVMEELNFSNPYRLVWQSKVGPLPWLGPQTSAMVEALAKRKHHNMLLVPIAFTTDHIETLFELDIENAKIAHENGATGFKRVESLNVEPIFIQGMADLVSNHLSGGLSCSAQLLFRCPGCTNETCGKVKEYFREMSAIRS